MSRKCLWGLIFGFFFILFAGSLYAADARYAILIKTEGTVEVRVSQGNWQPAEAGMTLYANDEIRTGQNGKANLLLDKEGSSGQFEVNPDSRLRLNTLDMNQTTGDKTTILDLALGSVLVHAEKLQNNSRFQVHTPNSSTGVRGTTFLVSAEPKADDAK